MTKRANQTKAVDRRIKGCYGQMLQVHSSSIVRVRFDGMGPGTKIQHRQIRVCIERRAARLCCNDYRRTSSVTSVLQDLGWEDFCQDKKMVYRIASLKFPIATAVAARRHHQRFLPIYCSINAFKGSSFPSTVRLWYGLPASVISAPNLGDFKLLVGAGILKS